MDLISKEKVDVRVEDIIEQLRLHEEAVRQILHGGIEIHKKGLKAEMYLEPSAKALLSCQ
ncbi:hypothetical protein M5X00_06075 [Paenibacillus alvei]|uniref:Uncharacterized protein n=1 Tax=Paenibacillus alvei TaxID=44250 RepID=A0ABT4GY38_PAEAL|nr:MULTISPECIES: hypothetical protein [Paenibacillus]EJW20195.1 hypothetical protein PAV_1c11940 [Paenibacillus alvei DSM 29]MCY7486207.1 hypothetical protein [Paenibacillus alvei]MCY9539569.1 hypothetical protein [Paenibacillus alvei]MCY9704017.1 hypothetical protein [Paenibacillus alvei]MCY9734014.1 hypothetical protein [Paenibacillus alvei]